MKLVRFGKPRREKPGLVDADGNIRDLSKHIDDIDAGALAADRLSELGRIDPKSLPLAPDGVRLGPPVGEIRKCICTGPNYYKMSQESGAPIPEVPRLYMKADTSITGPTDDVAMPAWGVTVHWEVEIGVVIGTEAWEVPEARIMDHVAGYAVINDIVDHEAQTVGYGESVKGRSAPGFGPIGPWLVTKDEIPDIQNLHIWLEVDGHRFTDGNSNDMVFKIPYLVSYVSSYMKLRPGDVICTGTPGGVGRKTKPPFVLKSGNVMRLGIEGLGEQRTRII